MTPRFAPEEHRLALQAQLDAAKPQAERNRLGQFATPTALAADVMEYARSLVPSGQPVRFLDPAFGTGSFYSALVAHFPPDQVKAATGFELDPHYLGPTRNLWQRYPIRLHMGDFTRARPEAAGGPFDLVVCNPPYVRHHHLGREDKERLQAATAAAAGIRLGGLAGLYCHFMAICHAWMADGGVAGWLVPSEFMDVNYGEPLKRYLLDEVELIRVHRFDPQELQFGDALVSSAVVWFRKRRPTAGHNAEFSFGGTLAAPHTSRRVPMYELRRTRKWTGMASPRAAAAAEGGPRLADFFQIKRGIATGDNSFFVLSRTQAEQAGLPREFLRPILPGPRHLSSDLVESDPDGVPRIDRQRFLLDCRLPESDVARHHPALWAYLRAGKATVGATYLCSRRTPWYAQEDRPPAPFLCTYMGRNLTIRAKPFRFILNRSRAIATNVYLLLYPKPDLATALRLDSALADQVWRFLDAIPAEVLLGEGRVYGGGLYKMEPKELANVPADAVAALVPATADQRNAQADLFATAACGPAQA